MSNHTLKHYLQEVLRTCSARIRKLEKAFSFGHPKNGKVQNYTASLKTQISDALCKLKKRKALLVLLSSYTVQRKKCLLLGTGAESSVKPGFLSACVLLHPETQAEGNQQSDSPDQGPFQTQTEQLFTTALRILPMTLTKAVSRVNHIPKFPIYSPLLQ